MLLPSGAKVTTKPLPSALSFSPAKEKYNVEKLHLSTLNLIAYLLRSILLTLVIEPLLAVSAKVTLNPPSVEISTLLLVFVVNTAVVEAAAFAT